MASPVRRFVIWSVAAAAIGLVLAGAGVAAWWAWVGRSQPVVISAGDTEVQALLDEASWLSPGGAGEPVYVVGYRDSEPMQRFLREEGPRLRAAGGEPRLILFARPDRGGEAWSTPAERATVAELWLTRDWGLYERWAAAPSRGWRAAGLPPADGDLAREAVVEAGRALAAQLGERLGPTGARYPLVIWRSRSGALKLCACDTPRAWSDVRDDLGAAPSAPVRNLRPAAPTPSAVEDDALPYPDLGEPVIESPLVAPAPVPAPTPPPAAAATPPSRIVPPAVRPRVAPTEPAARPAPRAEPSRPTRPRSDTQRRAPEAKRDPDSTFF